MLYLNYIVQDAGWANLKIGSSEELLEFNISYLHNSLKNLAESAIELKDGKEKCVVFMDEPGELWLILKMMENNVIDYELRWYEDWASWNLIGEDKYEVVLTGKTTYPKYVNEVRRNLIEIYEEIGIEKYKEKWIEHEFPLGEYERLR